MHDVPFCPDGPYDRVSCGRNDRLVFPARSLRIFPMTTLPAVEPDREVSCGGDVIGREAVAGIALSLGRLLPVNMITKMSSDG
jgi:hypothetical protein